MFSTKPLIDGGFKKALLSPSTRKQSGHRSGGGAASDTSSKSLLQSSLFVVTPET